MASTIHIWQGAAGLVLGAPCTYLLLSWRRRREGEARRFQGQAILERARQDAGEITSHARLAANEEALRLRQEIEESLASRRAQQADSERRLLERESMINAQLDRLMRAEKALEDRETRAEKEAVELERNRSELATLAAERRYQLQHIAGLSAAEARREFLKEIEIEALRDAGKLSREILAEAKARAEEKARRIISIAIQRHAAEHTSETTAATITLQDAEIKGRIIGRDGRNIRAFEAATGVTVLIDDTPNAVVLSSFDPVRREIAKEAMLRLVQDGRIHPTRIEEVVAKVSQETDESIIRLGEEAVSRAGLPPMQPELVKVLGRLHFRHSYSQNILDHSVEVAQLMGLMAAELGVDVQLACRAGLLHDIGKALTHEVQGSHALVGADFARRHGESEAVVNAVASHHNEVESVGPLGFLVSAADAISASRPGARSESMATYLKRVEDLERIGMAFPGVEKCYAVHAGRELRVFVHPGQAGDGEAFGLARSIAQKIESDLQYPGQIKVTVIRETRCVEVAK
jgi:ribonuclease Y